MFNIVKKSIEWGHDTLTLETGRVLDYSDKGDDHRKLCSMYLSLMDRMGVRLERFGDADTRLAGF